MRSSLFTALAGASVAAAHFTLQWPPTAGFDDDAEPNGPCGGAVPVFNSTTPNITVDQFAVAMSIYHPTGAFQFSVSTQTSPPYNFQEILPFINTTGLGSFCLTNLYAPSDLVGKSAVLQIVDYSIDGTLYQCAPVNFISGANTTVGPSCQNATNFAATWTSQENSSTASTSPASSVSPSSTPSPTHNGAAAIATGVGSLVGLGLLAVGLVL